MEHTEIKLKSKYSDVIHRLVQVRDKTYLLKTTGNFVRVLFDYNPEEISSIDLEGGPIISVGNKIEDFTVNKIWHSKEHSGFLIEFL